MTFAHDRNLQTGIATSVGIHALLLFLLVTILSRPTHTPSFVKPDDVKPKEPEVALLFPNQIIKVPPIEKEKAYIRTTQNKAALVKPKNATFQSDRNTFAASEKPPVPGSLHPMPTLDGNAPDIKDLINRDYKEGEIKNDSATAKADAPAPLEKIMEELDKEQAKEGSKLPIEVRKAENASQPPEAAPAVRIAEEMPPKAEKDAFTPGTRTAETDGSISQEGDNAVNAEATPRGMYERQAKAAIEQKWNEQINLQGIPGTGRIRFHFFVDKKGVPQDLEILSDAKDADPKMREFTLRLFLDAEIPPIPLEVLETLEDGRMKIEYEAIIY